MFTNIMDELDYDVANFNPTIKESLLASLAFFISRKIFRAYQS